jgi:dipeptidyl aminopeptidase/acylaminoacyl peptidase
MENPLNARSAATSSDDVWHPERVTSSAHGATVAFVVAPTRAGATEQSGLWAGELNGSPVRLGEEVPDTNLAIREGTDGVAEHILFGVTKEGHSECVIHEVATGEQTRIGLDGVAEAVAWSREGLPLILVAEPGADSASLTSGTPLLINGPFARSNRAPIGWRRVWRVDVATMTLEPLSPADISVWEFTPIDGGRVVAIASTDPTEAGWYRSTLSVLGPSPQEHRDFYRATWQITSPSVSPDGTRVAFVEGWSSDRGLGNGQIRCVGFDSGEVVDLEVATSTDVTWLRWREDNRLWFAGWRGLDMAWGTIDSPFSATSTVSIHAGGGSISVSRWRPQVVPTPTSAAISVHSSLYEPPEVCVIEPGGEVTRWSELNADVVRDRSLDVNEVHWEYEGVRLEGLLIAPRETPGPHALVVDIHGGPSVSYHHSWDTLWAETLCAEGYAVFFPNPFGGPGRGGAFSRGNLGDPLGTEFDQVIAGVQHLVASGLVDAQRTAVMGASYGGYMTASAVARGGTFRGGVVIAGISNLQSCWATANNAPFYELLCGGTPRECFDLYVSRSPVNFVSSSSLPALILHGELDQCVPVSQARELFANLTSVNVPAELVIYPGEGHQVRRIDYIRDQRRRIVEFLRDIM